MKYTDYEHLVIQCGVKLAGWMEVKVCPIEHINTNPQLQRLLTALNTSACCWEELSTDELATCTAVYKA